MQRYIRGYIYRLLYYVNLALLLLLLILTVALSGSGTARAAASPDAFRVLFLGLDRGQLVMVALYTIPPGGGHSRAYFFPPATLLPGTPGAGPAGITARAAGQGATPALDCRLGASRLAGAAGQGVVPGRLPAGLSGGSNPVPPAATAGVTGGEAVTLASVFYRQGAAGLETALAGALGVPIAYYVQVDQAIMPEVRTFIPPIIVDGQEIDLGHLFTMSASPQDEIILGRLLQEFTRPRVYFFHLPRLVLGFRRYVATDFPLTLENLVFHYHLARSVDMAAIEKVILQGVPASGGIALPAAAWARAANP